MAIRKNRHSTVFSQPIGLSLLSALLGVIAFAMMMTLLREVALAAPPIGGNPISVEGPQTIPGTTEGVIRTVIAADFDADGYPDLAFGQGSQLRIQANNGLTTTQWAQAVTVGSAAYNIHDVHAVDLDHDGAPDLVTVSADGAGNSQLRTWRNPTAPFNNAWSTGNTLGTLLAASLTTVDSADLDNNGTSDLVSGGLDGVLRLWSNPLTGTLAFDAPWPSPVALPTTGDQVRQILVADIDRDGKPDIVEAAGNDSSGVVRLWQNPGNPFGATWTVSNTLGTFSAAVHSLSIGDLDNDGAPDVIAGLANGQVVTWHSPLTGSQLFTASWGAAAPVGDLGLPIYGLVVTDADHDGRLDVIAIGSGLPSTMAAWRNTGQPFASGWAQVTFNNPADAVLSLTVADFNRDGDDDFVTASGNIATDTGNLQYWTNVLIRSSARFETHNVPHATNPLEDVGLHAMDVHDIDRDGLPDIVVATLGGSLILLHNDGTPFASGTWPATTIGASSGFFSVVAGDLDSDGWPDIATSSVLNPAGNTVQIWHNDGSPFSGTWTSQVVGTFPRQVMDLALGDVAHTGHLQIVAATGITSTFESLANNDVPVSDDNAIWLLRPPTGDPFASPWISSTVCTTTYSANSVAVGDLDNDGWLDVVFGTDHAPFGTTAWPDTSGFYDGPAYQVRACRNLGDPYSVTDWSAYDLGRDDALVSSTAQHHRFWGAHVWDIAIGDLDNDGNLDVVSGGGAEGDYQVLVYRNDGTPFDTNIWATTAVGYGTCPDGGSSSGCVPGGTYPQDCPWLEDGIYATAVGDLNGDGWLDLVSGFGLIMPLWLNTGEPFGETVTDTHWIRYDISTGASGRVYGVEAADLDRDGRMDIAATVSWDPRFYPGPYPLHVWRNLGGIARHTFQIDYGNTTIEDGASEAPVSFAIRNNGRLYDHNIELDFLRIRLEDPGDMTSESANELFRGLLIYRDANGDNTWQVTDSPVATLTDFSLINAGNITITVPSGNPSAIISPSQTVTYFIVVNMQPTASQTHPGPFHFSYTPHNDLLLSDTDTEATVSVEESTLVYPPWITPVPVSLILTASPSTVLANGISTSTITATLGYAVPDGTPITFTTSAGTLPLSPYVTAITNNRATAVLTSSTELTTATVTGTVSETATGTVTVEFVIGPRASLHINDASGPSANQVATHTMTVSDTFTVFAAAYDAAEHFIGNPTDVIWSGAGVVAGHLSPTVGVSSTTFTPASPGSGHIIVTSGAITASTTVTVTDVPITGLAAINSSPTTLGQATTLTATVTAGSNVSYTWALGDGDIASGDVVTHTYPARGVYTATVTATNSANVATTQTVVTVSDVPIAGLAATNDSPTTLGQATTLTATVTAGSNVSYTWALGDGDIANGSVVVHPYPASGLYTATVTATNNVNVVTTTTVVTITDVPIAGLAAINSSPTTLGQATTLTATVAAGSNVSYTWALGDGDIASGGVVVHTYPARSVYTATVTATNSAGVATTQTVVTVSDIPIAGLAAINSSPTTLGQATTLTATVTAGSNVSYTWALGDGDIASGDVVTHTYPARGVYTATVTATNSANVATTQTVVTVSDVPIAGLVATNDSPTTLGQATTLTATVTAGSNVSYTWALGDGSTANGAVVTHTYLSTGVYTATVTATNNTNVATAPTTVEVLAGEPPRIHIYLPLILANH